MTWVSKSLIGLGITLLTHSCFSAHEYSSLYSIDTVPATQPSKQGSTTPTLSSLPTDISVELIVAIVITCLGLVLNNPELEPIQWRVWASKIEREGEERFLNSNDFIKKGCVGNSIKALESRPGFIDIRKQRQEFLTWSKSVDSSKPTQKK